MEELEKIKRTLDKLNYKYVKANTKSKMDILANDLLMMSSICEEYFHLDKLNISWKDKEEILEEILSGHSDKFILNIEKNNKDYFHLFYYSMYHILNSHIDFYKYYNKKVPNMSKEELADIFYSFLKNYDINLYNKYIDMLKEEKIYAVPLEDGLGLTFPFVSLNDNYIFITNTLPDSLHFGETLAHEFGHVMESDLYMNSGKGINFYYNTGTPFYEVSSSFIEYAFLNYLKENNIHKESTDLLLNNYYLELLINTMYGNILSRIPNIGNKIDEYDYVDVSSFNNYIRVLEKNYNCYAPQIYSNINETSFTNSYVYGIGQIFSIYLYDRYKNNPFEFKKEFSKVLLNYQDISSFESLGITKDTITEGKVLRRALSK